MNNTSRDGKKTGLCALYRGDILNSVEEPSWIISIQFFSKMGRFQNSVMILSAYMTFCHSAKFTVSRQNYSNFGIRLGKGIDHSQKICHPQ